MGEGFDYPSDVRIQPFDETSDLTGWYLALVKESVNPASIKVDDLLIFIERAIIPLGSWMGFIGQIVPDRWLKCEGGEILRSTLLGTFLVNIGLPFGPGNGSTTVSLPNWEFRSPYGADGVVYMPGDEVIDNNLKDNTLLQHHHSILWPGVLQIRGLESGGVVYNVLSGVIPSETIDTTNTGDEEASYQVLQRDFGTYYIMYAGEDIEVL